ncbi:hypothetical protein [Streptomyces californicus]|uniref:hypothetical protein n=1 Tax=Streptomyces californicus TaxID=67351 RepID=UPI0037A9DAD8
MSMNTEETYGPESPNYGLSYEPDSWADPEPVNDPDAWELDFREDDPNEDTTEALWEEAFREGRITRDQFARRRDRGTDQGPAPEPAPQREAIASAVAKLRAGLADPDMSAEQRAVDERALASLEKLLLQEESE